MTIQELYYDERFNNVVYFLSECGFSSLEDLKDFDFDELLFVPGVSEEIIEDVKKLYVDIQNVQEQKADRETANEKDFRTLSAEVIKPIPLSVNFSKDIELQNIFLQCTDSLRAIFKRVSSQDQIVGFRSDNANYLHGALRYLYPDDFEYERDLLVKHGMLRVTFGERLVNAIKSNGGPIAKKELLKQFPGVTDIRIVNAIVADPKLIQWDYNEFNHIDNVHCTDSDAEQLHIILDELLNIHGGYSSENNFYNAVKNKYPGFLEKNKIESSLNLFYIAAYLFSKDYRFSRPHIASQAFPDMELTNINVARFFVADRPELYYQEFVQISQRAGWSNGTFTIILNAIEKDYIRVDLNRYIHRSLFSVTPDAIEATRHQLENLAHDSGYYGIFAIFSYDGFPAIDYEWNEHLLQSIIENYDMGFRLLEPKVKDRRYKKGIIVFKDNPCQSYEDFVIAQMKADGITSIAKDAFSGYLRRKGLVLTATIPFEFYDGDGLRLEGNNFVFG